MERITKKQLESKFAYVAEKLGHAGEPWTRQPDGTLRANVGVWMLHNAPAYGGYAIEEMMNESGGETRIFGRGSAKEVYAYLCGLLDAWFKYAQDK